MLPFLQFGTNMRNQTGTQTACDSLSDTGSHSSVLPSPTQNKTKNAEIAHLLELFRAGAGAGAVENLLCIERMKNSMSFFDKGIHDSLP
jgi:hypothetical protein